MKTFKIVMLWALAIFLFLFAVGFAAMIRDSGLPPYSYAFSFLFAVLSYFCAFVLAKRVRLTGSVFFTKSQILQQQQVMEEKLNSVVEKVESAGMEAKSERDKQKLLLSEAKAHPEMCRWVSKTESLLKVLTPKSLELFDVIKEADQVLKSYSKDTEPCTSAEEVKALLIAKMADMREREKLQRQRQLERRELDEKERARKKERQARKSLIKDKFQGSLSAEVIQAFEKEKLALGMPLEMVEFFLGRAHEKKESVSTNKKTLKAKFGKGKPNRQGNATYKTETTFENDLLKSFKDL